MSDDQPDPETNPLSKAPSVAPVLRREAMLPNERSRGLGTVAVVCTMAGVASGLALATTLMAMQVADSMSTRGCPYQHAEAMPAAQDRGFLGVSNVFRNGVVEIDRVFEGTPAEAIGLQRGDHILTVNGERMDSLAEITATISSELPGTIPSIVIKRGGTTQTVRPTLVAWPVLRY
jgi:S1-C subfamily serine protease